MPQREINLEAALSKAQVPDDAAVSLIAARCAEPESGGRMIDAMLTNTLLPQVGRSGSGYSFE
jgi:ATP-dependent Clp protease ATP-binding subunit ClpA